MESNIPARFLAGSTEPATAHPDPRLAAIVAAFEAALSRGDAAACDSIHAAAVATRKIARAA